MRRFRFIAGLILFLALLPVFSVLIASALAGTYDCTLHEGFPNPCRIGGLDWGNTLYSMFVMGWLALATLPIAALVVVLWLAFEIAAYVRRRRQRA
ncbi:MAG: hypothetical protein GC150_02075 [Rhizobiales bacterium]|nr:hypothetical protein [Hyphomicrobiales bacterium]